MKTQKEEFPKVETKLDELKSNTVGNAETQKHRLKAIEVLKGAKEIESAKKEKGYRWMNFGKTNAFVHPDRFEHYKQMGFRFI